MNFIFFLLVFFIPIFSTYGLVGHSGEGDKINGDRVIVDKIILREPYIQKISEQFKSSNIVVVHGLAGMGKSTTIKKYF
jgi:alpha-D-ribose 1-methylphosphonate 5-triphosphate synthase subunit PhnL